MVAFAVFFTLAFTSSHAGYTNCPFFLKKLFSFPTATSLEHSSSALLQSVTSSPVSPTLLYQLEEFTRSLKMNPEFSLLDHTEPNAIQITATKLNGGMNEGVHLFVERGQAHALKILPAFQGEIQSHFRELIKGTRRLTPAQAQAVGQKLAPYLKEIQNLYLAESISGPKLNSAGVYWHQGEPRVYLDMEWMGYDENAFVAKGCKGNCLEKLVTVIEAGTPLPENAAELLIQTYERKIIPVDPDFIYNDQGKVRWIDVGLWSAHASRTEMAKKFAEYFWESLSVMTHYSENKFPEGVPYAKRMADRFLIKLRDHPGIPTADKSELLHEIEINFRASRRLPLLDIYGPLDSYVHKLTLAH